MIEILLVMLIVSLLMGVVFVAFASMRRQTQHRVTGNTLQQLANAAEEYRARMQRDVRLNDSGRFTNEPSIEWFIRETRRFPDVEAILMTLGDNIVTDNVNGNMVPVRAMDAWNAPIAYCFYTSTVPPSDLEVDMERLPKHPHPFFASAGPDGEWGDHRELLKRERGEPYDAQLAEQAEDNVYSFNLD